MTSSILFAGQEDISFLTTSGAIASTLTTGKWAVDTTANRFRSTFARYALSFQTSNSSVISFLYNPQPFSETNVWTSGRITSTTSGTSTTTSTLIAMQWLTNNGSILRIRFNGTGTVPQSFFVVEKVSTAGVATQLGSTSTDTFCFGPANTSLQEKIDVYINYAVSGQFTVYKNGQVIFTFSGDVTSAGASTISAAYWGNINVSNSTSATSWSEMIVSTKDTRNFSLMTQIPTTFISQCGIVNTVAHAWFGNFINYQKIIANYNGTLTNTLVSVSTGANGTYKMGVYNDNSNRPGTLLGSGSFVGTPPNSSILSISMSNSVVITSGTSYWVAMINNTGSASFLEATGISAATVFMSESIAFASALPVTATPVVYATGIDINIWMGFNVSISNNNFTTANIISISTTVAGTTPDTSNTAGQIQEGALTPAIIGSALNQSTTITSQIVSRQLTARSVVHHALAGIGPTNLQNLQFVISRNNVNYFSSNVVIGTGKNLIVNHWDTDPATSTEWSTANLALYSSNIFAGYKSMT